MRRRFSFAHVLARLAGVLIAGALPSAAMADVLEIGAGGPNWIAGGPRAPAPEAMTEPVVIEEAAVAIDPVTFTPVGDAAGPAEWQGRVAELAAKYDISPTLLEAVVWQESRWNARALSPAGARGLAQLMPGTARQMGVDLLDPSANLEGGARYLRMQLDLFEGDIEKALAAYNAGPLRVQRAGGIPAIRETQLYVTSILSRLSAPVR